MPKRGRMMKKRKYRESDVTKHAVDKYMALTGCTDRRRARLKILELLGKSRKAEIPPDKLVRRLINNKKGGEYYPAEYFEIDRWRITVTNGRIVTFENKDY